VEVNWVEALWVNSPLRTLMQARELRFFRRRRPLEPGACVLEIGCGRGEGASMVSRAFRPSRIDGIDIDPRMIRLARRRGRAAGGKGLEFRVGDAQRLPYPEGSMDAVFNFGIIHHLEDWREGIREIARVLKAGGAFYFEEIYPDLYANAATRYLLAHPRRDRFGPRELHDALERAGLRLLPGCRESRYRILGVAVKPGTRGSS